MSKEESYYQTLDKRSKEYRDWKKNNPEGLGDTIENILHSQPLKSTTEAIKNVIFKDGKDCGCDKRKEQLNKIFPYRIKPARCLTENEYKEYSEFKQNRTLRLSNHQIKFVCKLYSEVFKKQYFEPCRNCSAKPMIRMIESLDKVFDSYEGK